MNNTVCLFACSNAFTFALYVTLKSFFRHSPKLAAQADVRIYAYQWDAQAKALISSCGPVSIIDYDIPLDIPRTPQIMRFSPALYARFEAFNLLDRYQNVICLDSDILVQKELIGVVSEMTGNIGLVKDTLPTVSKNFMAPVEGYDLEKPCFNAGFIVLKQAQFPAVGAEVAHWLYAMLAQQATNIELGDQGLINLALQKFNLAPYVFSDLYNLPASSSFCKLKKAYIVHSTGHRKFWCYYFFKDWYSAYAQWRAAGGISALRSNTRLWDKLLARCGVSKRVFFELAPDGVKYPDKFLRFTIKYWLYRLFFRH